MLVSYHRPRPVKRFLIALGATAVLAVSAQAASPVLEEPASVGISSERLERLDKSIEAYIARKEIAGAVGLIARRGKVVYHKSFGERDAEAGAPMTKDVIFRIASMTKPIVSVALMTLWEEGRFQLRDPVSKYLPEFDDAQVAVEAV